VVDLVALAGSDKLNSVLTEVFNDPVSLKVGIALRGDLTRILNSSQHRHSFAASVKRYVDLGLLHQDLTLYREDPKALKKLQLQCASLSITASTQELRAAECGTSSSDAAPDKKQRNLTTNLKQLVEVYVAGEDGRSASLCKFE